jgi:predicted MFS family arabinose efflux permease
MQSTWLSYIGLAEDTQQKTVYLFIYAAWGVIFPYFPVFFESLGMSKSQIGILGMIPNMSSFFAAPIFSVICDSLDIHWEAMVGLIVISVIFTIPMVFIHSFALLALIVWISSTFRAPIGPLLDAMTIHGLADKTTYGNIRLWGAVSYGIQSFVGGWITSDHTQSSYHNLLYLHGFSLLLGGFVIVRIIHKANEQERMNLYISLMAAREELRGQNTSSSAYSQTGRTINHDDEEATSSKGLLRNNDRREGGGGGEGGREFRSGSSELEMISFESSRESERERDRETDRDRESSRNNSNNAGSGVNGEQLSVLQALALVCRRHPSLGVFALIVFLSGFGSGVIESFLFVRMKQLGGSGLTMGISRFLTCAAEVPMFQIAGVLHKKYGTWPVLALTQFAFVLRFTYYSLLTEPWAVLPCELLHGLTFATTWTVSCTYANMISPPECHSSMQALLEGLHWGFGSGMGSLIGGFAYDRFGAVWLFEASALLSVCSMFLAMGAWYVIGPETHNASESHDEDSHHRLLQTDSATKTTVVGGKKVYASVKEDEEGEYEEIYFDHSAHSSHGDSGKSV